MTSSAIRADAVLKGAGVFWFVVALVGQWAFLYYIVAFYGVPTAQGNFASWNRNTMLFKGYVPGDTSGNLLFAAHVLLAGVVAFGGTMQLVPQIRSRFIAVHRWNGRLFLLAAMTTSVGGFYLTWARRPSDLVGQLAISLDGVLIVAFGMLAWRAARSREIASHRRWAMRAFIAANGVWFMRLGFMAWIAIHRGPVALKTFNLFWQFGSYLLPLLVLELYLRARERVDAREKLTVAGGLVLLTLLMGIGIAAMYAIKWGPLLAKPA